MARLPVPHSDNESWGDTLNGFLGVSLNDDGSLRSAAVTAALGSSSGGAGGGGVIAYGENATTYSITRNDTTYSTGLAGSTQLGVSFTAPSNGAVFITLIGEIETSATGTGGQLTYQVAPSGGSAIVTAGAGGRRLDANPNSYFFGQVTRKLTGLAGGSLYTVTCYHRNEGTAQSTTTYPFRAIMISAA